MHDHLASLVVQVRPERQDALCAALDRMGVEVHAAQGGKLVVTIEAPDEAALADTMNRMNLLDGVYSATLVFHSYEGASP